MTTPLNYSADNPTELAQDDRQQESSKGWGTAARMPTAIAEALGWTHGGHRHPMSTQVDGFPQCSVFGTSQPLRDTPGH